MKIEPYTAEHFLALTGQPVVTGEAALNQVAGPAYALRDGGKVIAIGGVRVQGIGQAWALLHPEILKRKKDLLRTARLVLAESIQEAKVYRLYAEASVDAPAFYEHLGFTGPWERAMGVDEHGMEQKSVLWVR